MHFEFQKEDDYEFVAEIGSGTCGTVHKVREKATGNIFALKRIIIHRKEEGFPVGSIKEISFLKNIVHPNVIHLETLCRSSDSTSISIVFEYCEYDLHALIHKAADLIDFNSHRIRCYMHQALLGLQECHSKKLIHRDLKPPNILVKTDNRLILTDFGLAMQIQEKPMKCCTNQVITLWYRPPELLLGATNYGPEIDIWSLGCVFYEMITRKILFQAPYNQDLSQLQTICSITGIYNHKCWQGLKNADLVNNFTKTSNTDLRSHFQTTIPHYCSDAIDLLLKMLEIEPDKRISAKDALQHPYFLNHLTQLDPLSLHSITIPDSHQNLKSQVKKQKKMKASCCRPPAVKPPPCLSK